MAGFRKAKAEQAALKIGLYGPPGSGKTFTSLLLTEGLEKISGKRTAFVDTEHGTDFYCQAVKERPIHPEAFDFDAIYTKSISDVCKAVQSIQAGKEYGQLVIVSMTHLWEACRLAYTGRTNGAGQIPFHAWGKIKKPYKDLMAMLLSSPLHVIICGRQGTEYAADEETEELKAVGVKMKAEGETPYEPHILIRMWPEKQKSGVSIIRAWVEKDRTGILGGKMIDSPTFETIGKPLMHLLGGKQAHVPNEDEVAAHDGAALASDERERQDESDLLLKDFSAEFDLAKSAAALKGVGAKLTPEVKKRMLPGHVTELREKFQAREKELSVGPSLVAAE